MIELIAEENNTAQMGIAGDSYNTAVYLKQALPLKDVAYITALGDDAFSDKIVQEMHRYNINTQMIERRAEKIPSLYAINTDQKGERSFSYWRNDSAARTLFVKPCKIQYECFKNIDLIFLSGISIAILPPETRTALLHALDQYRTKGGLVAFDSNYRPKLWQDTQTAQKTIMSFWRRTDIALPSLDDEIALFAEDNQAVYDRIGSCGVQFGAMKRGEKSPSDLQGRHLNRIYPSIATVIDTTAAGDSFNAGFLAAYIQGKDITQCLDAGYNIAMQVVQQRGAIVPVQF